MKRLALAVHSYLDKHGCFPPAYLTDDGGKPMHSWRVLLLPYLEETELYESYDLDKPWDSPHNRAVTEDMPQVYRCPDDSESKPTETNYMMIVGPHTISDGPGSRRLESISDWASRTIMFLEVTGTGVHWAEPRDLNAEQTSFAVNDSSAPGIGSNHQGGANVAFVDGSIRFLSDSVDPADVEAMTTIDGGETVKLFED